MRTEMQLFFDIHMSLNFAVKLSDQIVCTKISIYIWVEGDMHINVHINENKIKMHQGVF